VLALIGCKGAAFNYGSAMTEAQECQGEDVYIVEAQTRAARRNVLFEIARQVGDAGPWPIAFRTMSRT